MLSVSEQPDLVFLRWLVRTTPRPGSWLERLPEEIFSPEALGIVHRLRAGVPRNTDGAGPPDETTARVFIRDQLLSLVGRETIRAQHTGDTTRLRNWIHLLDDVVDGLKAPPLAAFETIEPQVREVVPTGIQPIDDQIRGLAKGELGIVVAPPGRGKTAVLINMTRGAALLGYSVLYISVADQATDELTTRMDTCLLGEVCPSYPTAEQLAARHQQAVAQAPGAIWIADYTDRECSMHDIEQAIVSCDTSLVIVDHADDVLSPWADDPTVTRHSLRAVYLALKRLSVKYQVPIWTASQSHEATWYGQLTGISSMAEAKVGKATGAAIILGFSGGRQPVPGIMYCTVCKARRAYRDSNFPVRYRWDLMRVW